jgi:hypothetical protein
MKRFVFLWVCGAAASLAAAQTSIDPSHKFSWQENTGWMNWADAAGAAQGVRDQRTYLQGSIWCENIGWLNVGEGLPPGQTGYSNADGATFGVNVSTTGELSGYAWAENVGWVNFEGGALAAPPQPARIDDASSRFRGYAWCENIGWINLDHATHYVGLSCYANCDASTVAPVLTANDFQCFLTKFAAGDPQANCDRSSVAPVLNANDFQCFLNEFAAGCS